MSYSGELEEALESTFSYDASMQHVRATVARSLWRHGIEVDHTHSKRIILVYEMQIDVVFVISRAPL